MQIPTFWTVLFFPTVVLGDQQRLEKGNHLALQLSPERGEVPTLAIVNRKAHGRLFCAPQLDLMERSTRRPGAN